MLLSVPNFICLESNPVEVPRLEPKRQLAEEFLRQGEECGHLLTGAPRFTGVLKEMKHQT